MEDSRWLRLMSIGLVLAALAVGYFLFTSRFSSNTVKTESPVSQATPSANPSATSSSKPSVLGQVAQPSSKPAVAASPTPASAYSRIVSRNQVNGSTTVASLPDTGFPAWLVAIVAVSTMFSGWGLRRFPH